MKIEGKVFVICGGASGLGRGTAEAVAAKGGKIAILDRNEQLGREVVAALGFNAAFFSCDVMSEESILKAVEASFQHFGRIDGNLNAAGGAKPQGLVDRKGNPLKMQDFERDIRLNLIGSVSVMSKCAAKMCLNEPDENGERGCIINIASVAYKDGQNGQASYSAAKAGLVGLTLPTARDMGSRGVRINTVAPGLFDTGLTVALKDKDGNFGRVGKSLAGNQVFPNTRFGQPHEFGHLAVSIFENVMINAETIHLDAGIRMGKL